MESKPVEIPIFPAPGEMWFSINLDLVQESELPGLLNLLERYGLPPTPAFRGEESHYLLWQGRQENLLHPPDDLFVELQQELSDCINPDAISFRCCLTPATVAA